MITIDKIILNIQEELNNEAKDIAESADEARAEADNTLYELRRESERLSKKARNIDFICSIPLLGSLGEKNSSDIHTTLDEIIELSHETNEYYESLLYSKNLIKDYINS